MVTTVPYCVEHCDLVNEERFKKFTYDGREMARQIEAEEKMPDHIKEEMKKLRISTFNLNVGEKSSRSNLATRKNSTIS